jgi:hypothetical protein
MLHNYFKESRTKATSYVHQKVGRLTGLATSYVGTAFYNTEMKEKVEDKIEGTGRRERIREQYWMIIRKREGNGS